MTNLNLSHNFQKDIFSYDKNKFELVGLFLFSYLFFSVFFNNFSSVQIFLFENNFTLLFFILFIPLVSIFGILLFSRQSNRFLHKFALISSSFSFVLTMFLLVYWKHQNPLIFTDFFGFDQIFSIFIITSLNFEISLGIDGISVLFLILTNLFIYLSIFSLPENQKKMHEILIYLFLLQWSVLAAFSVLDILGFFIFFETTLIPIYFIVLIWGSRERKVRASYLISVYTFFGSIFMLFNVLYLYSKTGVTNYIYLLTLNFTTEDQKFLWITFFIAFAAKIPMFPLHIWLPEAHVEAPTLGSVLLAVLLLKLGTYGIIRFLLPLFPEGTIFYSSIINTFAILSIIYTSLTAIRQIDIKKIIAYASIGHMNAVLLGIISLNPENLEGAIFQMLSHGIVSGALFFCVGSFYKRYKVRSLKYFGGFMRTYPLLSLIFLLFSMANISFPGTSSFVGEFVIFLGLMGNNSFIVFLASINMITGAVYTLWAYNRIAFGNLKNLIIKENLDLDRNEFYLFFILIFGLFLLGLKPNCVFDLLHYPCSNIIEHAKLQLV